MEGQVRRRGDRPEGSPWLRGLGLFLLTGMLVVPLMGAPNTASVVAAAAETPSPSSWVSEDSEVRQALETLLAAGIISPPTTESAPLSREEVALWLYRLLTHLQKENFLITDPSGALILSPAARAVLQEWVAGEVAAQLAVTPIAVPPRERVIERQVVVEAGPQAALPALTRAEDALQRAQEALENALAAQKEALAAQEATGLAAARLKALEEELCAVRQALEALEVQMRDLSQLGATVAELTEQVASLNRALAELQTALGMADQRMTAIDLRVAATQGDIETLRLLIDRRAEELAKNWGIEKGKLETLLAETRSRIAAVEKDAVRQEALAAVTALVEARTGHLEAAINQLVEEFRPELARLDQRLAAVEAQIGRLDERVSALEAGLKDQGIRLQRIEERSTTLRPRVWATWVSTACDVTGSSGGNLRYGLEISWDRFGQEGALAGLAGSWQSEWEPGSGSLWQRLKVSKLLGAELTGNLVLELLPLAADGGESSGAEGIRPLAANWSMEITKAARNWPELALSWGGSSRVRGQWWRAQISVPVTEADAPFQLAVSGWFAGGWTGLAPGQLPYLYVSSSVAEGAGPEVGYRLLAEVAPRDGSIITGGWEWRQKNGVASGLTARQGWLSLKFAVGGDASLSLVGRRWWFTGQNDWLQEVRELRVSLDLPL